MSGRNSLHRRSRTPGAAPRATSETGAREAAPHAVELDAVSEEVLRDLMRRVRDIDNRYRAAAERMGQLYMSADANEVVSLTRSLDAPMRNASENERTFAAILEEMRLCANRRK